MNTETSIRFPTLQTIQLMDGFWKEKLSLFRRVTILDVFNKFDRDRGGAHNNFKHVRDGRLGYHAGPPWYDGLLYECIRGVSDFLAQEYDPVIDARVDGYIQLIEEAQNVGGDGYFNTYTQLICPENRFGQNGGNLLWQHDLYNTGCLMEAAVHHYNATGKVSLLRVAVKTANYICSEIGVGRKNIVPAHSLPEEAYLKLYQLFCDEPALKVLLGVPVEEKQYFDLVDFWMHMRGKHDDRCSYPRYMGEYSQDHRPILEQREAVGHAVRAALLYTGIAAYANMTGDAQYAYTAEQLWKNIIEKKMHISGGIGAIHSEEKFGVEYELPNDAYLETCASAALMFFGWQRFLGTGDGSMIDVMEQALYNGVLPGISLSGDHYFYRNPLKSTGEDHRWPWHDCPCCPPMFLKVMGELPRYIFSERGHSLFVNLYVNAQATVALSRGKVSASISGEYPWHGTIAVMIHRNDAGQFDLRLRIPGWCRNYFVTVNGEAIDCASENGYVSIERNWQAGDRVLLKLDMPVVRMASHPYVHANADQIALMRGPMLYCVEGVDNDMKDIVVPEAPKFAIEPLEWARGAHAITFEDTLYRPVQAIPYYLWDNRAASEMKVWLTQEAYHIKNADQWGTSLYLPYSDVKAE